MPLSTAPGSYQLVGSFGGDTTHAPSSDSEPFAIAKAQASLSAFTQLPLVMGDGATGLDVDPHRGPGRQAAAPAAADRHLHAHRAERTKTFSTITDYLGRATLPPVGLAAGTYSVSASFAGDATYTTATRTGTLVVSAFSGFFPPVANPPTGNIAKAGSAIPVKFSLGGNRGLAIFAAGCPVVTKTVCATGVTESKSPRSRRANPSARLHELVTSTFVWKTATG